MPIIQFKYKINNYNLPLLLRVQINQLIELK